MKQFFIMAILLFIVLGFMFRQSANPKMILFSNDLPFGMEQATWQNQMPGTGAWQDLNLLGLNDGVFIVNFETTFRRICRSSVMTPIINAAVLFFIVVGTYRILNRETLAQIVQAGKGFDLEVAKVFLFFGLLLSPAIAQILK